MAATPPDPEPAEAETVLIKGFSAPPGGDPFGPMAPVEIRVPADHPLLRQMGPVETREPLHIRIAETLEVSRDDLPDAFSRQMGRAVAEHAERMAYDATLRATYTMKIRLEAMRHPMTAAVQERLRAYFGQCQRDDRRPLTWDTASYAVGAMIEFLTEEMI